jgi:sulfite reductase alpha subunit-like flavoprotein
MAMAEHKPLDQASDEELATRVRELMAEMAPLEEALGRLRTQIQQLVSEQKRRERSQHLKSRMQLRTTLAQGQMPTLQQIAESANDLVPAGAALKDLRFFRDSGTEIGLGYATGREPTVWMTNGSSTVALKTVAEIRGRYVDGWDFGTAAHPGVRIHIPNSRTEKIVAATDVFLSRRKDA